MKMKKEHKVPLSDSAVALLKALPREAGNPFVFIGPWSKSGLSNMALTTALRRIQETGDYTDKDGRPCVVHGFRSTFRDWASETTTHASDVVEKALAHVIKDKSEAAYRRGDLFEKRVRLMHDWASYLDRPIVRSGDVVPIGAAR
jgi:integrase